MNSSAPDTAALGSAALGSAALGSAALGSAALGSAALDTAVRRLNQGERLDFAWGHIVWTVSRALGNSQTTTFGLVTIKSGQANPRHRHPNCDEVLHLISGQIEHSLGDESCILNAGDTISIPLGTFHNAKTLSEQDALMAISFSSADRETEGE